jgi:hypothetical protein
MLAEVAGSAYGIVAFCLIVAREVYFRFLLCARCEETLPMGDVRGTPVLLGKSPAA